MNFDDWVDVEGLAPEERARLERAHELLLAAGPPATLPSGLEHPPQHVADVIPLRSRRRRRGLVTLVAAAALVAAAFAGGYFTGHRNGGGIDVVQQVSLQGAGGRSFASLAVGRKYSSGNWPIEMTVKGLPQQANERSYYLLLLWRDGKPAGVCGAFRVSSGSTKVRFDVPYSIDRSTRWVVTAVKPGERYPGTVMMKTVRT